MGKQVKSSFKAKNKVTSTRPLQLLHMDLFGPYRVTSLGGKHCAYVIIDNYSRFTWVHFLTHKNESFEASNILVKRIQNEKVLKFPL